MTTHKKLFIGGIGVVTLAIAYANRAAIFAFLSPAAPLKPKPVVGMADNPKQPNSNDAERSLLSRINGLGGWKGHPQMIGLIVPNPNAEPLIKQLDALVKQTNTKRFVTFDKRANRYIIADDKTAISF